MLEIWWQKNSWLGKTVDQPLKFFKNWHGIEFKEFQAFWVLGLDWELSIRCANNACGSKFRAFSQKCLKLYQRWDLVDEVYKFMCPSCSNIINCAPQLEKVIWIPFFHIFALFELFEFFFFLSS